MINENFYDKLLKTLNESVQKMEAEMIEFHNKIIILKKKKQQITL